MKGMSRDLSGSNDGATVAGAHPIMRSERAPTGLHSLQTPGLITAPAAGQEDTLGASRGASCKTLL